MPDSYDGYDSADLELVRSTSGCTSLTSACRLRSARILNRSRIDIRNVTRYALL